MALINLDFESHYLGFNTNVNIIMPDQPRTSTPEEFYGSNAKYKVLWLLHGTFGGHSDWIRKSNIELYACEHDLIVVMPSAGNSDYEEWDNFKLGYDAEKMIIKELMPLVHHWLPASDKPEDNFIAGLSMGGHGALRLTCLYPEKFGGCASLSFCPRNEDPKELKKLFGLSRKELKELEDVMHSKLRAYNRMHRYDTFEEYWESSSNNYGLLIKALEEGRLPPLFFSCGTEDPLMAEPYEDLKAYFKKKGYSAVFTEGPGSHEWRVWERDIQKALAFFGIAGEEKGNAF